MKKIYQTRIALKKQAGVLAAVILAIGMNGITAYAANRWRLENGNRYYLQDNQMVVNQWFSTSQEITYDQKLPSDLVRENETRVTWYYVGPDGAVYKDGWHEIDGQLYYFNAGGANTRKGWIIDGEKRYYADENGIRNPVGWFSITGKNPQDVKYQVFEVPGVGKRLINTAGKVMKGTKVKDGMDQSWTVASNGEITVFGDQSVASLNVPEEMLEQ